MKLFGAGAWIVAVGVWGCGVNDADPDGGMASGGASEAGAGSTAGAGGAGTAGEGGAGHTAGEAGAGDTAAGGAGATAGESGAGAMAGEAGAGATAGAAGAISGPVGEILNDPAVKSALEEAREQGVEIVTHTEENAPDLSGYYSYARGAGEWIASGNGANVGFATTAAELRIDLNTDGSVDTAIVSSFDGITPASHGIEEGYLLRGVAREVTLYGRRKSECKLSGASYALSQAYIWTGTLADGTGDWIEQRQFLVTTATEGELTSECADALVGNVEVVGGWAVVAIPLATKVPADDLVMMCVDEGRGYVPSETWTRADGSACECLTDFSVSCEQ